jgi:hypothetical protein
MGKLKCRDANYPVSKAINLHNYSTAPGRGDPKTGLLVTQPSWALMPHHLNPKHKFFQLLRISLLGSRSLFTPSQQCLSLGLCATVSEYVLNKWRCVCFFITVTSIWEKQLKGRRIFFGSWFQPTVSWLHGFQASGEAEHHGGRAW